MNVGENDGFRNCRFWSEAVAHQKVWTDLPKKLSQWSSVRPIVRH